MNHSETDLNIQIQVDEICEEFEGAFKSGGTPRIEDYLDRVDAAHRSTLVQELIVLDIGLRSNRGEKLSSENLIERYVVLLPPSEDREAVLRLAIDRALASTAALGLPGLDTTKIFVHRRHGKSPTEFPKIDGFEIESVLGEGGMGIVYKATQLFPRRPVALKMILNQTLARDDESKIQFLKRFEMEAQAIAELNDPRFVQIYQFGEANGLPFMAIEFVEGGSLEAYRRGEPQPIEFATRIVEQLARGMHKAHRTSRRVVHRDLKPHNVLLTVDGLPKIADFGLAKWLDFNADLTEEGMVLGTPSYMAPEQTYGTGKIGPEADIYALGGILYCLLTGHPPFQATNKTDTFEQVRNHEPVPPIRLNPKISKDLDTICLKCLEKEPARRYGSAEELAKDLRCFDEGLPIAARPISHVERSWRWAKRNPWVAALGSTVAALIVTIAMVTSVMSWQLSHKNQKLTEAIDAKQGQIVASLDVIRNNVFALDSPMRGVPSLEGFRRYLLKQTLEGLNVLQKEVNKNNQTVGQDPLVNRTFASLLHRTGEVHSLLDSLDEAKSDYARAYEILEGLYQADGNDPANVRNLAAILTVRGDLELRLGQTELAKADYQRSLELREQWVKMLPDHSAAKRAVAQSHGYLAKVDLMQGNPDQAITHLLAAKAIHDLLPIPGKTIDAIELRREQAANEDRLGLAEYQLGHSEKAQTSYLSALQRRQALAKEWNNLPALLRDVALSHIGLGDLYLCERNEIVPAWEHYTEALHIFAPQASFQRNNALALRDYAGVQYRLGATFQRARDQKKTLRDGKEPPDPRSHFEESRKLREQLVKGPQDTQANIEWALAEARCGKSEQAIKLAQILESQAEKKNDPYLLFQVACTYALCSENPDEKIVAENQKKAFEVLNKLTTTNWKDLVALKNDPDLDPIRKLPEFEELRNRIAKKE